MEGVNEVDENGNNLTYIPPVFEPSISITVLDDEYDNYDEQNEYNYDSDEQYDAGEERVKKNNKN